MLQCWGDSAKTRPSFSELCQQLDKLLSTETAQVCIFLSVQTLKAERVFNQSQHEFEKRILV